MSLNFNEDSSKGGWRSAIFIIFVEMAERFAFYGIAGNLIIYLTTVMGRPVADAAKTVNSWNGVSSLSLFVGAFVADSYLGRFKTTLFSSLIFLMGLVSLTMSVSEAIPHHLRSPMFFMSLFVTAVGDGCHKPCVQTFAADQFDEDSIDQKKAKSSFFNWWFFGIVIGATVATLVVIYVEENVGWAVGFSIPTVAVAVALMVFLIGSRSYRRQRPAGSPFSKVARVVVAAVRKRSVSETRYNYGLGLGNGRINGELAKVQNLARTNQFRFLDKAMIIDDQDSLAKTRNPWRQCTQNQVEEVKLLFRILPIWLCTFGYAIVVAQVHTFFIKQASTMNRSLGHRVQIPPASLQVIPGITILTCIPVYDKLFIPTARKLTRIPSGITALQRVGAGLGLSILTIVIAALVEAERIRISASVPGKNDGVKGNVPMSVGWLVPQFMVMGLSDLFAYVGMQELFYDQMPEDMRSIGSALTNGVIGAGAFLSSAVITAVQGLSLRWGDEWLGNDLNKAHLDHFYWVLAGLSMLNLGVYVLVAKWFVLKKIEGVDPVDVA